MVSLNTKALLLIQTRYLYLLTVILANNQFYYNLNILNTFYYSFISVLRSLLKDIYTYRYLLLTFLFKSFIIINKYYTLFISLYRC